MNTTAIHQTIANNYAQLTSEGSPWETEKSVINNIDYTVYKNAPKTLAELLNAGRAHGDNEFIIYNDERLTFAQFFQKADALAYALQSQFAIKQGEHIAIAMRNYPEWMIAFTAIVLSGGVAVPLNSWGQQEELLYGIKDSQAVLAILDEQRLQLLEGKTNNLPILVAKQTVTNNTDSNIHKLADIFTKFDGKQATIENTDTESCAMIMYTSGTTGRPKGAVSSHRNICQAIYNFEASAICAAMSDSKPIEKMLERGHPPKVLLSVPLFHVSGCYSVFLLSLRAGRPIVMMYKWNAEEALELIEKENITMISAVPAQLSEMLNHPKWDNYNTSSMFGFGAGGSAQPPTLAKTIYEKLPDSFPGTGYGMTESNAAGFITSGASYKYKPASSGVKTPIVDIKITDANGEKVKQGNNGEIWLKSPTIISGYWKQSEESTKSIKQGWLKTGDIGYLDEEGFLFITDRIKDIVIRGGENIYSLEVEAATLKHPSIIDAAAFGVPCEKMGEELALAVVCSHPVTKEDIQKHISNLLAGFKVPKFIYFEESLPKNASLKTVKPTLKKQYSQV